MRKLACVLVMAIAACSWQLRAPAAMAQTSDLQRVVVTEIQGNPEWTAEEKAEAVMVRSWGEEELSRSSAEVLSDFLAEQGVGIFKASPTDQGHTLTNMRGFRTDHLSKELDGRLMFLINGHRTGTANASQIPLVNVERVEILRGPEMLRYSAASSGGVINVVTRKGGPEPLGGSLEVGYGFGSFEAFKGRLALHGLVGGFDYSLGYSYQTKDSYKDGEGYLVKHTGVGFNSAIMAEAGYTFNEKHRVGWTGYFYNVDKAERPAYVDPADLYSVMYQNDSVAFRRNVSNTFSYDGATFDDKWAWNLAWTFGNNLNEMYSYDYRVPGAIPMANSTKRQQGQASLAYEGGFFTVTGGVDYLKYETGEGSPGQGRLAATPSGLSGGRALRPTGEFKNLAGYLVGNVRFLDERLILSGGLRYDYYKVKDLFTEPNDYDPNQANPKVFGHDRWATEQSYSGWSPSLGVSWLPWDVLKLRANWTRSFRAPSPRELFSSVQESYGFWGFPWNKAEYGDTYEIGFDLNDKWAKLSATYFYSLTKNYIYQHNDPIQDRQRVRNADKQRREGIEISLSSNITVMLGITSVEIRPYANLSYLFRLEELYREGGNVNWGRWTNTYGGWLPKMSANYGIIFNKY